MNLSDFKYLVALGQERHFARAAEKCLVTQPALSLSLKKLEEELGVQIFERSKSEVFPTTAGREILKKAEEILAQVEELKNFSSSQKNPLIGTFKLGVIPTVAPYLLPEIIAPLRKKAPEMPLDLTEKITEELLADLKSGQVDAVIMALPVRDKELKVIPLYNEDFCVIVPQGHLLSQQNSIQPSQLKADETLMLHSGHCFRDQVTEVCPGLEDSKNASNSKHQTLETIKNMVASGLGISVMPESAVTGRMKIPGIKVLPFQKPIPYRKIALVYRAHFARKKAAELITEIAQKR